MWSYWNCCISISYYKFYFFGLLIISYIACLEDKDQDETNITKKLLKIVVPIFTISLLIEVFIPTTKEALVIYGVGGTVDYLKANPTAKKLPDKCINALDKWVDSFSAEKNDSTKKKWCCHKVRILTKW